MLLFWRPSYKSIKILYKSEKKKNETHSNLFGFEAPCDLVVLLAEFEGTCVKFIRSSLEILVIDFLSLTDDNSFGGESGSSSLEIIVVDFLLGLTDDNSFGGESGSSSLEIIVVDFLGLTDDNFFGGESGSSSLSSICITPFLLSEC